MTTIIFIAALFAHLHALYVGLAVLFKHQATFMESNPFSFDDVEKCYLVIAASSIIIPVGLYHIGKAVIRGEDVTGGDTAEAIYWFSLGFLITMFHVVTGKFMDRIKKSGHFGDIVGHRKIT